MYVNIAHAEDLRWQTYSPERHTPAVLFLVTDDIISIVSRHVETIALLSKDQG